MQEFEHLASTFCMLKTEKTNALHVEKQSCFAQSCKRECAMSRKLRRFLDYQFARQTTYLQEVSLQLHRVAWRELDAARQDEAMPQQVLVFLYHLLLVVSQRGAIDVLRWCFACSARLAQVLQALNPKPAGCNPRSVEANPVFSTPYRKMICCLAAASYVVCPILASALLHTMAMLRPNLGLPVEIAHVRSSVVSHDRGNDSWRERCAFMSLCVSDPAIRLCYSVSSCLF